MPNDDEYYLNILKKNGGFSKPYKWLEYAKNHSFQRVKSQKLLCCPDCRNDMLSKIGQYIYYSNIMQLYLCNKCGLYFSDTLIDPRVIRQHFEMTYKDEIYFKIQRKAIFEYISLLADKYTPIDGKAIDIGGGKGHLLQLLMRRRADIDLTLNDLSKVSCDYCSEMYGIKSLNCAIKQLGKLDSVFDTIMAVDVVYYESNVNDMFDIISKMLNPVSGTLILRIPNKLKIININQSIFKYLKSNEEKFYQDNIKYFNPEHIFIFSSNYLKHKLKKIGFQNVRILPSPFLLTHKQWKDNILKIYYIISRLLSQLSFRKITITPSMIVIAIKNSTHR